MEKKQIGCDGSRSRATDEKVVYGIGREIDFKGRAKIYR